MWFEIVFWLLVSFAATWAVTNLRLELDSKLRRGLRKPPPLPYWFPGIGHTFTFLFKRPVLVDTIEKYSRGKRALKLSIIGQKINVVTGAENIKQVWRAKMLDSRPAALLMLRLLLQGRSSGSLDYWVKDNSGAGPKPHPGSNVAGDSRIYHPTWKASHLFLTIKNSEYAARHIQTNFKGIMENICPDQNAVTIPDLRTFFQTHVSAAVMNLMCGQSFLDLNPDFLDRFWEFDDGFPLFLYGLTQVVAPKALKARDACVEGIERWHSYAAANFDEASITEDGFDPYWGSRLFRGRQEMWKSMDRMDANAKACEDFGIIWAMNTNTIPAVLWSVVHCFQDKDLLRQVREEVSLCKSDEDEGVDGEDGPPFDIAKLTQRPLLQSICSEILRLYVAAFIPRGSAHEDFVVADNYKIPKGQLIAVDSYTAHRDTEVWNTGRIPDSHPLDTFWAERFVIDPERSLDGPLRENSSSSSSSGSGGCPLSKGEKKQEKEEATESCPKYSMDGLSGAWLPFGGGKHQCPGRYFARREMLVCLAVLCWYYDFDFLTEEEIKPDHKFFGIGTMPPKGEVPVRITRREVPSVA